MGTVAWANKKPYSKHLTITTLYEECLLQLFYGVTWDGDLIGSGYNLEAVQKGHAKKIEGGWNMITEKGVLFLIESGAVRM